MKRNALVEKLRDTQTIRSSLQSYSKGLQMNTAIITQVEITSLEIAELTEKDHDKVTRDIEEQLGQLKGGVSKFGDTYIHPQNKQTYKMYRLPKRETLILVSGYDVKLRAKIIDRLNFLETKAQKTLNKMPTYLETAKLLVQSLEQNEALALTNKTLEKQNTILMHSNKLYTATEIAKEVGFKSAVALNKYLNDQKIQYKVNKSWVLYSDYADCGYTSIKQDILENGKEIYDRKWTQTGRDFILKLFNTEEKAA